MALVGIESAAQVIFEGTLGLDAKTEKSFEFPAEAQDALNITFKKVEGKKVSMVVLYNEANELVYKYYDLKNLKKKVILKEAGRYKLTFINNEKKDFTGDFAIVLVAQYKKKRTLSNKRVVDTSYAYTISQKVALVSTVSAKLQEDKFYLNSRSNALVKGGKNRVLVPVNLPEGTKEWYYVYSASRDVEQIENTLKTFDLASALSTFIDANSSLQQSVSTLNAPPGAHIADVYVLDEQNAVLFRTKEHFEFDLRHSRENYKSGIVHVKDATSPKVYLGLNNPDNLHGIHVGIEVVAIVDETSFGVETVRIPVYTSYTVPVFVDEE
jgi:hypothetical protein